MKMEWMLGKKSFRKYEGKTNRFTLRFVTFSNKQGLTGDQVKDIVRKDMHLAKRKIKDNYDVIYAQAYKVRRRGIVFTEFNICVKPEANCIFVIPNSKRKVARKAISEMFIEGNFIIK